MNWRRSAPPRWLFAGSSSPPRGAWEAMGWLKRVASGGAISLSQRLASQSVMAGMLDQAAHQQAGASGGAGRPPHPGARRYLIVDSKKSAVQAGQPAGGKVQDHHCVGTGAARDSSDGCG